MELGAHNGTLARGVQGHTAAQSAASASKPSAATAVSWSCRHPPTTEMSAVHLSGAVRATMAAAAAAARRTSGGTSCAAAAEVAGGAGPVARTALQSAFHPRPKTCQKASSMRTPSARTAAGAESSSS